MEASRHHISILPMPHSRLPVSPAKELVNLSGSLIFEASAQETPLNHLALVASGAYTHWSHRTIPNGERVLNRITTFAHLLPPKRAQCKNSRLRHTSVFL